MSMEKDFANLAEDNNKIPRQFVIGDIHGGYKAFMQCLDRCNFNYDIDELICLGDTVDGWNETDKCFHELLKIKNLIYVIGNHDMWFLNWAIRNEAPHLWTSQGGNATMEAYGNEPSNVPQKHKKLLMDSCAYMEHEYPDGRKVIFVHGGLRMQVKPEDQKLDDLMWDRDLLYAAMKKNNQKPNYKYEGFDEIYVGHTSLYSRGYEVPTKFCNVWAMDTGGGWEGKLSIMDTDTKEIFQSDKVSELYPDCKGRG